MDWLYEFPFKIPIDLQAIDKSVRAFSVKYDVFFGYIRGALVSFVNFFNNILDAIPWFVLILLGYPICIFIIFNRSSRFLGAYERDLGYNISFCYYFNIVRFSNWYWSI